MVKKYWQKFHDVSLFFFLKKKAGSAGEKSVWKSAGEISSKEVERMGA